MRGHDLLHPVPVDLARERLARPPDLARGVVPLEGEGQRDLEVAGRVEHRHHHLRGAVRRDAGADVVPPRELPHLSDEALDAAGAQGSLLQRRGQPPRLLHPLDELGGAARVPEGLLELSARERVGCVHHERPAHRAFVGEDDGEDAARGERERDLRGRELLGAPGGHALQHVVRQVQLVHLLGGGGLLGEGHRVVGVREGRDGRVAHGLERRVVRRLLLLQLRHLVLEGRDEVALLLLAVQEVVHLRLLLHQQGVDRLAPLLPRGLDGRAARREALVEHVQVLGQRLPHVVEQRLEVARGLRAPLVEGGGGLGAAVLPKALHRCLRLVEAFVLGVRAVDHARHDRKDGGRVVRERLQHLHHVGGESGLHVDDFLGVLLEVPQLQFGDHHLLELLLHRALLIGLLPEREL
mmetsp:Transcript_43709/g.103871  ORF Transcript_43709/g.103871 Transcript_43709/m.103871 type:complete len:410 (-) Transcript_43709:2603-3832(-)